MSEKEKFVLTEGKNEKYAERMSKFPEFEMLCGINSLQKWIPKNLKAEEEKFIQLLVEICAHPDPDEVNLNSEYEFNNFWVNLGLKQKWAQEFSKFVNKEKPSDEFSQFIEQDVDDEIVKEMAKDQSFKLISFYFEPNELYLNVLLEQFGSVKNLFLLMKLATVKEYREIISDDLVKKCALAAANDCIKLKNVNQFAGCIILQYETRISGNEENDYIGEDRKLLVDFIRDNWDDQFKSSENKKIVSEDYDPLIETKYLNEGKAKSREKSIELYIKNRDAKSDKSTEGKNGKPSNDKRTEEKGISSNELINYIEQAITHFLEAGDILNARKLIKNYWIEEMMDCGKKTPELSSWITKIKDSGEVEDEDEKNLLFILKVFGEKGNFDKQEVLKVIDIFNNNDLLLYDLLRGKDEDNELNEEERKEHYGYLFFVLKRMVSTYILKNGGDPHLFKQEEDAPWIPKDILHDKIKTIPEQEE